jgi:hypothetical protein
MDKTELRMINYWPNKPNFKNRDNSNDIIYIYMEFQLQILLSSKCCGLLNTKVHRETENTAYPEGDAGS